MQPQTVSNEAPHSEMTPSTTLPSSTTVSSSITSSDPVLSLLQQLTESNQALLRRVENIEKNASHIGFRQGSHSLEQHTQSFPAIQQNPPTNTSHVRQPDGKGMLQPPCLPTVGDLGARNFAPPGRTDPLNPHLQTHQGHLVVNQRPSSHSDLYVDGVIPDVDTLRRMPTIAQSVTSALAAYKDQAKLLSMQGKHLRRSGHYNTGETVNTLPENR